MNFLLLTLYPDMFPGMLAHSLAGQALNKGLWQYKTLNIRDFAEDKHRTVDDTPYGGGAGMVLKPDILGKALDAAIKELPNAIRLYPSPRGEIFRQKHAIEWQGKDVIFLCGRFEGIDQRVIEYYDLKEISLGDFVLSGGEVAALAMMDAAIRLIPGVMGNSESATQESFNSMQEIAGLLEYPHYTRPPFWKGLGVPETLLSGDHQKINRWRMEQSEALTQARRADLWKEYQMQSNLQAKNKG